MRRLIAAVLISAWATTCLSEGANDPAILHRFFGTARSSTSDNAAPGERPYQVVIATMEMQEKALPILLQALTDPDENKRYLAIQCLASIPGPEAASALRKRYTETKDIWIKTARCSVLAASATPDDVRFLIQSLKGKPCGDEGVPMAAAAYSLGILRAKEAEAALKTAAQTYEGSLASQAARCALNWINGPRWKTPQQTSASGADAVILSVLRFGIPRSDESEVFLDSNGKRLWKRKGDSWSHETRTDHAQALPSINFSVAFTRDSQRAVCSVGLTFGPLNGSGFDIILKKEGQDWRVVGICQTWIS